MAHLDANGIRAGMSDHLVSEAIYVSDPDGLGIEVYADRAQASWRYADDQLVMSTDPLDGADLVAAGQREPWDRAPEGTVMGHVHLHVGGPAAAAAFDRQQLGFDLTT